MWITEGLNAVTKPDTFPLPRIDDLLGAARYFSTLDLASGYGCTLSLWRRLVRYCPWFRVMHYQCPQRIPEAGLNPEDGPNYVVVYIDDVLVFSRTLVEHLEHLRRVICRLQSAGLKLKPSKCKFIREEVEYLGHLITPKGLKTNCRLVAAVAEFPQPQNVWRFWGSALTTVDLSRISQRLLVRYMLLQGRMCLSIGRVIVS